MPTASPISRTVGASPLSTIACRIQRRTRSWVSVRCSTRCILRLERVFEFLGKRTHGTAKRSGQVNQPTSRLDMLRFARRVVEQQTARQLALIDRWIADEERREAERRQG